MHRYLSALLCLLLLSAPALAADAITGDPEAETASAATRARLDQRIASIEIKHQEIRDVLDQFRSQYKLNILVRWGALQSYGIERSATVSVKLQDVTVARALEAVLADLNVSDGLGYAIEDGVVVISSLDDLSRKTVTRMYPAADLLTRTRRAYTDSSGSPWLQTNFLPTDEEEEDSGGGGLFGGGDLEREEMTSHEAASALRDLVTQTVAPDTWRPKGDIGSFDIYGTNLIVTQTLRNHEQVEALLTALRRTHEQQRVRVGLATIRLQTPDAAKQLRLAAAKGGDIQALLIEGEDEGLWVIDRCQVEDTVFGEALRATDTLHRKVTHAVPAVDGNDWCPIVLGHSTLLGYEIGLLPKSQAEGRMNLSVACGSGWIAKGADITNDTAEKNTPVSGRHNVFDFHLAPGQAAVFPVIPLDAQGGAVRVVVWVPPAERAAGGRP